MAITYDIANGNGNVDIDESMVNVYVQVSQEGLNLSGSVDLKLQESINGSDFIDISEASASDNLDFTETTTVLTTSEFKLRFLRLSITVNLSNAGTLTISSSCNK